MLLALILALQFAPENSDLANRVPPDALVRELEGKLKLPEGASDLDQYDRFYTQIDLSGRNTLVGQLVDRRLMNDYYSQIGKPAPAQITRGLKDVLQPVSDGGCRAAISVLYDVQLKTPPRTICNAPGPGAH